MIPPVDKRSFGYIVVPGSYIGKKVRVYRDNDEVTMFVEDPFLGGQLVKDLKELIDSGVI